MPSRPAQTFYRSPNRYMAADTFIGVANADLQNVFSLFRLRTDRPSSSSQLTFFSLLRPVRIRRGSFDSAVVAVPASCAESAIIRCWFRKRVTVANAARQLLPNQEYSYAFRAIHRGCSAVLMLAGPPRGSQRAGVNTHPVVIDNGLPGHRLSSR